MVGDNGPQLPGWHVCVHRDSPLTPPAVEPEPDVWLGEN